MMENESKKHDRRSIRLTNYDYSQPGSYFITICTFASGRGTACRAHPPIFGDICDGVMNLNKYGEIADKRWLDIPEHFKNVDLDEYVIMPNHVHGIITINGEEGTACRATTPDKEQLMKPINKFSNPISGELATIIRSYKAAVTKQINEIRGTNSPAVWQRNYYEHIIRNRADYEEIRGYIVANPSKWEKDDLNTSSPPT